MGEPITKSILYGGRFAGIKPGIFGGIFFWRAGGSKLARPGAVYDAAGSRLGWRLGLGDLNGSNMARVWLSRRLPLARVGCAWANNAESSGGACGSPRSPIRLLFSPVSSYGWALHYGMIKTCFWQLWKSRYTLTLFCFMTNGALIPIVGGRNHWWWLLNTQSG